MIKIPVYNLNGEKVKEFEISSRIFGRQPKAEVVHQVVVAQQANSRPVLAHTKDKSDVRGGGRKPWRQKGTGRARHGSIRSPLWVGGGVTFGPTKDRNFSKRVNKKQKQLALAMCLSDKVADSKFVVLDQFTLESGKTKDLAGIVDSLRKKIESLKGLKNILIVVADNDKNFFKASNNLQSINVITADSLNCVDVLKGSAIVTSVEAVGKIDSHYKKINQIKKK